MNKDDPDLQEQELAWLEHTEQGAVQANEGRLAAARDSWRQAADIAATFDPGDPRRAASWNNAAVGARLQHAMKDAGRLYERALEEWDRVPRWIEQMESPLCARSSVFHLQLELKHRDQFARWAFAEYFEHQPRGVAITLNNRADWYQHGGAHEQAASLYRQALEQYDTPDAPARGAEAIRRNLAASENAGARGPGADTQALLWSAALEEPFIAQARREEWIIDLPPDFTDEGRFMAGLACACLIERM